MKKTKIIVMLEIVVIVVVCLAFNALRERVPIKPKAEIIRPVQTMTLKDESAGNIRRYFGTVQGGRRVNLSFRVSGMLKKIAVDKGASVKSGAILATLDTRDFHTALLQAQSVHAQAKARFEDAQTNFNRYENLYKKRAISKAQYDASKTQVDVSQSAVNTASAQVKAARDALRDTELKAPFSGIITERMVENFQHIMAQQPIFTLQDISTLEIMFNIPDNDMILDPILATTNLTQAGKNFLSIAARFDAIPGRVFPLKLKEFSLQADTRTSTYPVTAIMPQQTDIRFLPGMAVTVEVDFSGGKGDIQTNDSDGEYTVPATAIQSKGSENFLWRYCEGEVHRVPIMVRSPLSDGSFKVSGSGGHKLKNGDVIVTAGVYFLREGQKVRLEQ